MSTAAQEPWAILAAIPQVDSERVIPPGTDISVARKELPRASVLTVPPHISLPACLGLYPYVAAADRSGLLLLRGTHPFTCTSAMVSHHICDARTGEAVSLPNPPRCMAFSGANVGLIIKGDGCMVAGLQSSAAGCTGTTLLLSYMVGDCCKWREREITSCSSAPLLPRDWYPEGVVSHHGMLWWVDLCYGLLACDPFTAEEPHLLHVPLPQVPLDELPADDRVNRGARRCVNVRGGRLRYVHIHGDRHEPLVSMWVLVASAWCPGKWEWIAELSVPLTEVWMDGSYVNTILPLSIPALAFLHPTNPDRVYFFLRSCIFEVDLQLRKLVGFSEFEMPDLPARQFTLKRSSRLVHAWQFDPSSTRPDFVSTCLRKEKEEIAAMSSSFPGTMLARCYTAKRLKRVWDSIFRQQQQQEQEWQLQQRRWQEQKKRRQQAMRHDFTRKCGISEESRIRQSAFLV